MGGVPQVILLCAISFLLNHEDMILTFTFFVFSSRDCRRLVEASFHFKKDTRNTASSPKIMRRHRPLRRLRRSGPGGAFSTPAKETAPIPSDNEDAAQLIALDDVAADSKNSTPLTSGPA